MSVLPTNLNTAGVANVMSQIRQYQAQVQSKAQTQPVQAPVPPLQGKMFSLPPGQAVGPYEVPKTPETPQVLQHLRTTEVQRTEEHDGFGQVVQGSLQKVNTLAKLAEAKRNAYEKGEEIPLTDVVLAMQKSSLAFEATLQIRNKVLRAYDEILNMPM
jgi:flagellar hook-basal body complex protein FliE